MTKFDGKIVNDDCIPTDKFESLTTMHDSCYYIDIIPDLQIFFDQLKDEVIQDDKSFLNFI